MKYNNKLISIDVNIYDREQETEFSKAAGIGYIKTMHYDNVEGITYDQNEKEYGTPNPICIVWFIENGKEERASFDLTNIASITFGEEYFYRPKN